MDKYIFKNGRIVTAAGIQRGNVLVEGSKIANVMYNEDITGIDAKVIDCSNKYIGPGFVDIHVHGGKGNDFTNSDPQSVLEGIHYHLAHGTTSIAPACISIPFSQMDQAISVFKQIRANCKGSILGFHIEGVYLNPDYRGGHLLGNLRKPNPVDYMPLIEKHADFISEWTLAPELDGAINLIKQCTKNNIVTSVGHSNASYDVLMEAIDEGLTHSTHFACVMGGLSFEALGNSTGKGYAPGVMETVLLEDRVTTEIIADGYHLHPGIIQLVVKCKGYEKVCIVTDAMMGVGLPSGEYIIGDQDCIVDNGIAIIKDRPEIIASSVTPMIDMLKFVVNSCKVPLNEAWMMASLVPAKVIRSEKTKGSIEKNKDADIVILDNDMNIDRVFSRGSFQ